MSQLSNTANLIEYYKRTISPKRMLRIDNNTYNGGNLGGVTITKKRKKPYWVSPKGAGNMTVMPGDPEMVFFAPIVAGAGITASPAISSMVSSAMSGINTVGDAVAATAAGQRLTSGLNFLGNAVKSSKTWPWIDAGLTSVFGAHGIDKVRRGDIHNIGDVVETGLDLLPLSQLARPVINTAGRTGNFFKNKFKNILDNYLLKRSNNFTNANDKYLDSFLNGTKPMILTVYKGPGFESDLNIHNILLGYKYVDLERPFGNGTQTLRYYINEPKLKLTIAAYKNLYKSRLNLNTNNVDDTYNHLINNPKLLDPNVNFGTTGLLDIIGVNLGYGPKDAILFNLGEFGSPGTKVSRDVLSRMKFYGYDKSVPGIYNILRKNIERGTLGIKPTSANGSHVGFGYIPSQEFPRGLLSDRPLIARGTPEITAENATRITPEQWTAAQDAAIARGDMAEAQRLRDLHFQVNTPKNRLVDTKGNPVKMIHGSWAKFTEFRHKDNPFGTHGRGMYFGVAPKDLTTGYGGPNGYTYLTYLNGKSIYPDYGITLRDNAGKTIPNNIMYEIIGTNSYDEFINSVTKQFKDRFELYNPFYDLKNIAKNIDKKLYQKLHDSFDTKGTGVPDIHKKKHWFRKDEKYATFNPARAGEVVVRDANQIKLADAVTYDDNGVRIPLGERDNFKSNDIRYSWLAPFIGLGTLGTLSNKK